MRAYYRLASGHGYRTVTVEVIIDDDKGRTLGTVQVLSVLPGELSYKLLEDLELYANPADPKRWAWALS